MNKCFELVVATRLTDLVDMLNEREDFFSVIHIQFVAQDYYVALIDTEPLTMEIGLTDDMDEPLISEQKPPSFA